MAELTLLDAPFPFIELYAPDGTRVGSASGTTSAVLNATLPQTGTYSFLVRHGAGAAIATYTLTFQCLSCPPSPPTCNFTATFAAPTVTLDFVLGTAVPATSNLWMTVSNRIFPVWSVPLPVLDPPATFELPLRVAQPLGRIGFLTTLVTADGMICSDFELLDTGAP
jgi:hypothetical protein